MGNNHKFSPSQGWDGKPCLILVSIALIKSLQFSVVVEWGGGGHVSQFLGLWGWQACIMSINSRSMLTSMLKIKSHYFLKRRILNENRFF